MRGKIYFAGVFCLLLLCPHLFARTNETEASRNQEETEEAPPPPLHDLMLSFYVWPLKGILPEEFNVPAIPTGYVRDMENVHRLALHRGALTPVIRYRANESPVLFRAEIAERDGVRGAVPVPLARPEIPPEWRQAVVLLYPEQRDGAGLWHAVPLHTATLEIPEGHSRILNSTSRGIVVQVDEHMTTLRPGTDVLLSPERLGDKERFRLRIYARADDGRERMIYTNSLPRNPEQNQLLIIHTSTGGRPNVLSLSQSDLVPKDVEAENNMGAAKNMGAERPAPGTPQAR